MVEDGIENIRFFTALVPLGFNAVFDKIWVDKPLTSFAAVKTNGSVVYDSTTGRPSKEVLHLVPLIDKLFKFGDISDNCSWVSVEEPLKAKIPDEIVIYAFLYLRNLFTKFGILNGVNVLYGIKFSVKNPECILLILFLIVEVVAAS